MDKMKIDEEAREALALIPVAKELMGMVSKRLPPGIDFGIMILVPGRPEGRVVALTTDRDRVAPAVAQWVLDVLSAVKEEHEE